MNNDNTRKRIQELREERGISRPYLAKEIGIAHQQLYRIELGQIKSVSAIILNNLAKYFNVSIEYLMFEDRKKNTYSKEEANKYIPLSCKVANSVKQLREDNNISQSELAELVDIQVQYIARLEYGASINVYRNKNLVNIKKIFNKFGKGYIIDKLIEDDIKEKEENKRINITEIEKFKEKISNNEEKIETANIKEENTISTQEIAIDKDEEEKYALNIKENTYLKLKIIALQNKTDIESVLEMLINKEFKETL